MYIVWVKTGKSLLHCEFTNLKFYIFVHSQDNSQYFLPKSFRPTTLLVKALNKFRYVAWSFLVCLQCSNIWNALSYASRWWSNSNWESFGSSTPNVRPSFFQNRLTSSASSCSSISLGMPGFTVTRINYTGTCIRIVLTLLLTSNFRVHSLGRSTSESMDQS